MSKFQITKKRQAILDNLPFKKIVFSEKSKFTHDEENSHLKYMFVELNFSSLLKHFETDDEKTTSFAILHCTTEIFELISSKQSHNTLLAVEICKGLEICLECFFYNLEKELVFISYNWMKPSEHENFIDCIEEKEVIDFTKKENLSKSLEPFEYKRTIQNMNFQRWCMLKNMESVIKKISIFEERIAKTIFNHS